MTDDMLIDRALMLATQAHDGQSRHNGDPYISHPMRVGEQVADHGATAIAAALLHDVVEDTEVTLENLEDQGFPPALIAVIDALTKRPGETYFRFISRAKCNDLARVIKMADIHDNMSDLDDGPRLCKYREALKLLIN